MKIIRRLSNRGDTIVEVLIVLAVLGLAFAISSATAAKGLQQSRNSEEHSQAMGVLGSQTELLRAAIAKKKDLTTVGGNFCIPDSANPTFTLPVTDPTDLDGGYPPACIKNALYHVSMNYTAQPTGCSGASCTGGYYTLRIQWYGTGGLGKQQEEYTYRTHQLTDNSDPGITLGSDTPQIQITVKRITPNAWTKNGPNPSPSCSSGNSQINKGGETINLTGATSQTANNIPDSGVTFNNLVEFTNYTATMSNVPSGFTACSTTISNIPAQSGVQKRTFLIVPQCTSYTTRDYYGYYSDYLGTYPDYWGYYSDYYGYYGDPYTVYWEQHDGWLDGYFWTSTHGGTAGFWSGNIHYHWYSYSNIYPGYSWYNAFEHMSGTAYTAPYDHWSAPYDHYSAPYPHYSAPYDHYSAYYTAWTCPT